MYDIIFIYLLSVFQFQMISFFFFSYVLYYIIIVGVYNYRIPELLNVILKQEYLFLYLFE